MNDELSKETCQFVVRLAEPALRELARYINEKNGEMLDKFGKDIGDLIKAPKTGQMSVKDLVGQGQGVTSTPLNSEDVRLFRKCADKYGVDFAVTKDKSVDPPVYNLFFKAKDADAVLAAMKDFAREEMKKKSRTKARGSVLEKLKKFKDIVAKTPRKDKEKKKEHSR